MKKIRAPPFSLCNSLECGQVFGWKKHGDGYAGVLRGKKVFVRQRSSLLEFQGASVKEMRNYFALDHDLNAVYREISVDDNLRKAVKEFRGLRILRQEPWECAVSFLCSQNSNIPRIEKMLYNLRKRFGTPLDKDTRAFPTPAQLSKATEKQLKQCGLGYRAKYVKKFADHIARHKDDFLALKKLSYEKAREKLMNHLGIGPKVADCVCLYALEKLEAFPIDAWMKKVLEKKYGKKEGYAKSAEFARKRFGRFAGYAQLYLFAWARSKRHSLK
ncbi:8-oxoguanine DNA glycosylase [Candidatus Micrarchaeota archaeon]|nr:8-oxoguanine DNA glycosylase [Candidatus Micrarchaeota archaeon]